MCPPRLRPRKYFCACAHKEQRIGDAFSWPAPVNWPGGRLVVLVAGPTEQGFSSMRPVIQTLAIALRKLVADGRLSEAGGASGHSSRPCRVRLPS
jgi:hypothetical protein